MHDLSSLPVALILFISLRLAQAAESGSATPGMRGPPSQSLITFVQAVTENVGRAGLVPR